ncbi:MULTISPECIES: HD domain-containing protein [unclassified Arcicella]|uniref:CCA tRNA nucleotidyltransferase n=1 Tax=unclassified Arcicella TaxID=2644986 RepID=UPI002856D03E|nr:MULTISPECIES: HD domain-containing protein [unclassified Arcicella]MDR6563141.1 putative nucleotidyltransferase with HDIG domain [Arcicella sp. BE51]MDR6811708.1 putative nucleotidyltransferase with HDIG domain [Arcicella sp. BE140]MDR6823233.1 putative nucleotidyltransferase with HDIG domain [Arcicella sp. BE139]
MNFAETLHTNPIFKIVADAAKTLNVPAYVVGGFVRDLILNRPSKDIDIVCVGSGIELAELVAKNSGREDTYLSVFKNFGTAMIKLDDWEVEFVGARRESYQRDSRKPIVEDGTLEDDQNRRDFTINAMAISLNENNFGELIDPFDGLADIRRKIIKTPLEPSITFSDDPLRMMRAIRFATQLNFDIHPDTFDALIKEKDRIDIISKERITDELNKIILAKKPSYGFLLLDSCGLLEKIFPEFVKLKGVETEEGKGHKDNFYHTLQVLDNASTKTDDLWIRWAAILHDIAKPATKRFDKKRGWTFHGHEEMGAKWVKGIFTEMRLPLNEKMRYVKKLVRLHLRPIALSKEAITDSALRRLLYEAGEDLEGLMILCRADITSKNGEKVKKYLRNFDIVEQKLKEVEESDKLRQFQPVVTGEIIMDLFGIKPSKEVGIIKIAVREAILEGQIENTLASGIPFVLEEGAKLGLVAVKKEQ